MQAVEMSTFQPYIKTEMPGRIAQTWKKGRKLCTDRVFAEKLKHANTPWAIISAFQKAICVILRWKGQGREVTSRGLKHAVSSVRGGWCLWRELAEAMEVPVNELITIMMEGERSVPYSSKPEKLSRYAFAVVEEPVP